MAWRPGLGLGELLRHEAKEIVVCHDRLDAAELNRLDLPAGCRTVAVADAEGSASVDGVFVLAVRDRPALRRAVAGLPELGGALAVLCCLTAPAGRALFLCPRPDWPPVTGLHVEVGEPTWTKVAFSRPAPVRRVLMEFARSSVSQRLQRTGWPVIGVARGDHHLWPPGDPGTVVFDGAIPASEVHGTPDVVLGDAGLRAASMTGVVPHSVTGARPVLVDTGPELSWQELGKLGASEVLAAVGRAGPSSLGALDDKVFNPIGFRRRHSGELVALRPLAERQECLVYESAGSTHVIDTLRGPTESDVALLRAAQSVAVSWTGGWGPGAYCRLVACLSMAGVPLLSESPPDWARLLLGEHLIASLDKRATSDDRLAREESSIDLRRAALQDHSDRSWRQGIAATAGTQGPRLPMISVLLCTRRASSLSFAIRQIARQRYADLELIIAAHGFDVDVDRLSNLVPSDLPFTAFSLSDLVPFGDALNSAASRASGDVLIKMDDDDWYGPEFVSDLELARMYSDADIVGCPAEFTFLEDNWLTTRTKSLTEVYRPTVAGGTIMISRATFRETGGFRRLRKHVDASLLSAVAEAGGLIYRTHGLGYVLRRGVSGHTWNPPAGYFLDRSRISRRWQGFHPSRVLELDSADSPSRGRNDI